MKEVSLTIVLLLSLLITNAQIGNIKGRVFDSKNNEPLPFANIIIDGTNIGSTTDLDGVFIFTGVKTGYVRLTVFYVGYKQVTTSEIKVLPSSTATINIPLTESDIDLPVVEIKATDNNRENIARISAPRTITSTQIEKTPGATRDVSKSLQILPGIASTPQQRNDLIVRGGSPSENSFYLDDIEIPTINHFSTQGASGGPVGIINPDFIREANLYTGAFPAERINGLSSVLVLRQKDGDPNKVRVKATIGASDLALSVDGPIDKNTTFIVSARRSYLQWLFQVLKLPFLPTYNDFQFKLKTRLKNNDEIMILGLGAYDISKLNLKIKEPDEVQRYLLGSLTDIKQWNYTIGASYKHFRKKSFDLWVISRSMLRNMAYKHFDNNQTLPKSLDYKSDEAENKARYEYTYFNKYFTLKTGGGVEYNKYSYYNYRSFDQTGTLPVYKSSGSLDLFTYNAFAQISKEFFNNRLNVGIALRFDGSSYSATMANPLNQISPRIYSTLKIVEKLFFNLNLGRYHQLPAYTTLGYRNQAGDLVNKQNNIKYIASNQITAGFEFLQGKYGKATLDGFFKGYDHYPFSVRDSISLANKGADFGIVGDEEVLSIGIGRAYGIEASYQTSNLLGFRLLFSYTWVRSEFQNARKQYVPSSWDSRNIFNVIAGYEFKYNWIIGARWKYSGGGPYSPIDNIVSSSKPYWDSFGQPYYDYANYNSLRLKGSHQLDLRVDKEFHFKKWMLGVYVDIQNLYNFQSQNAPIYTNLDAAGNPLVVNPEAPIQDQKYQLRAIENYSGTVLPTIGLTIQF